MIFGFPKNFENSLQFKTQFMDFLDRYDVIVRQTLVTFASEASSSSLATLQKQQPLRQHPCRDQCGHILALFFEPQLSSTAPFWQLWPILIGKVVK